MKLNKLLTTIITVVVILIVLTIFKPFNIVPADSLGLKFTLGKLQDKTLDPGLNFKMPIVQSIRSFSLRPMQVDMTVEVGPQGAITKDNQTVGAFLTTFYKYTPEELVSMYSDYGENQIKSILKTGMMESFKAAIGVYDIFSIAINQEAIQKAVIASLKTKMSVYPIEVTELMIQNYDWSDAFDAQIEETMKKAQQVKQKEQDLQIQNLEAQKKVKIAEADKQALILAAEGDKTAAQLRADAKALEGEGIRKYNESVQKNMELEVQLRKLEIDKIKAERWNGQYVPTNNYGPIPVQTGSIQGE